jgi:hypothetical protein
MNCLPAAPIALVANICNEIGANAINTRLFEAVQAFPFTHQSTRSCQNSYSNISRSLNNTKGDFTPRSYHCTPRRRPRFRLCGGRRTAKIDSPKEQIIRTAYTARQNATLVIEVRRTARHSLNCIIRVVCRTNSAAQSKNLPKTIIPSSKIGERLQGADVNIMIVLNVFANSVANETRPHPQSSSPRRAS